MVTKRREVSSTRDGRQGRRSPKVTELLALHLAGFLEVDFFLSRRMATEVPVTKFTFTVLRQKERE